MSGSNGLSCKVGSPPRMRGKAKHTHAFQFRHRITPACAGKRGCPHSGPGTTRDHPRVCGEKGFVSGWKNGPEGSPPHVRGKDDVACISAPSSGITPACAGKRVEFYAERHKDQDHPRMCGEKSPVYRSSAISLGSPPHVRGKVLKGVTNHGSNGITPACAGKSLKRSRSTVPPVAIVPLFPSVCNKPVVSDGSPAGRDAPLFLPAENAVPASPAYNLRSL